MSANSEHSANDTAPDYVEPLDAHRFWRLNADGYLTSVRQHSNVPWHAGERMEMLTRSFYQLPSEKNRIGFHSYKSPDYLIPTVISTCGYGCNAALLFGTVKIWGTVVEHELGYRSEHAMVNEINGFLLPFEKPTNHVFVANPLNVRKRATFTALVELLENNGYVFRAIDSPANTEEVRPGLYEWDKEQPKVKWIQHNGVMKGASL